MNFLQQGYNEFLDDGGEEVLWLVQNDIDENPKLVAELRTGYKNHLEVKENGHPKTSIVKTDL